MAHVRFIAFVEWLLCFVGRHDRMPLRRLMTRAERRRPHRRAYNIGVGRYGEGCIRCGKIVAGTGEPPRLGAL